MPTAKQTATHVNGALKNVWSAVSSFFTLIAQKLGAGFTGAKNVLGTGFLKAKDVFVALPKETKLFGALGSCSIRYCNSCCTCRCCFSKKDDKAASLASTAATDKPAETTAPAEDVAKVAVKTEEAPA